MGFEKQTKTAQKKKETWGRKNGAMATQSSELEAKLRSMPGRGKSGVAATQPDDLEAKLRSMPGKGTAKKTAPVPVATTTTPESGNILKNVTRPAKKQETPRLSKSGATGSAVPSATREAGGATAQSVPTVSGTGTVKRSGKMGGGIGAYKAEILKQRRQPEISSEEIQRQAEALWPEVEAAEKEREAAKSAVVSMPEMGDLEEYRALQERFTGATKKADMLNGEYNRLLGLQQEIERQRKWQEYLTLKDAPDFEEKSRYGLWDGVTPQYQSQWTGTMMDTGVNDLLFDYVNGTAEAQRIQDSLDSAKGVTHTHWKDQSPEVAALFNYIYRTQGKDAAYEFMDLVAGKQFTKRQAAAYGAAQGMGVTSALGVITALAANIEGSDEAKQLSRESYEKMLQEEAIARQQHPVAYGAGNVGGNLTLMLGASKFMKAVSAIQGIANSALVFATADAVRNAGAAANGYISAGDYLKSVGTSGVQGAAGRLAGGLVSSGMANVLHKSGLMTPFMEFVRQSASGFASAGANIGTGYLLAEEKPSKEQIATDLVTAFLFSVIQGGIETYKSTQTTKAQMNAAVDQIVRRYGQMSQDWKSMTPEARAEAAVYIIEQTQSLRGSLNSGYIAGQQATVDQLNQALDALTWGMQGYINGFQTYQSAAAAPDNLLGSTGLVPVTSTEGGGAMQLQGQLQAALTQGIGQAQTALNVSGVLPQMWEGTPTEAQKTTPAGGVVVKSSGISALAGKESLGKTLASNLGQLSDMESVAQLTGQEMNDRTQKLSEQIRTLFARIGSVLRKGFGEVSFGEYGLGGVLNHRPLNRAKMVSLEAVPAVIESGKMISDVDNWKGRGYRSVVFAAPVTIGDSRVYVAAVVNQNPDGKFYLSECVDSEGNYIRIEDDPSNGTKSGVTAQGGITATPEGSASGASILETREDVKGKIAPSPQTLPSGPQVGQTPGVDGRGIIPYNGQGETEISGIIPEEEAEYDGGAIQETQSGYGGTRAQEGERPGVPEGVRGVRQGTRRSGLALWEVQRLKPATDAAAGYHVPLGFVSPENWPEQHKDVPAYTSKGKMYIRSDIPTEIVEEAVFHEASHAMKELGYQPYLEFIQKTPDAIDFSSDAAQRLLRYTAKHTHIDLFNMTLEETEDLYDEIIATVSAVAISGRDELVINKLTAAFRDYASYKAELLKIHDSFKQRDLTGDMGSAFTGDAQWMGFPGIPVQPKSNAMPQTRLDSEYIQQHPELEERYGKIRKILEAPGGFENEHVWELKRVLYGLYGLQGPTDEYNRFLQEAKKEEEQAFAAYRNQVLDEAIQHLHEQGEEVPWWPKDETELQEVELQSDILDGGRRMIKGLISGKKIIGFNDLPENYQQGFREGLTRATPEVKAVLEKVYESADYTLLNEDRSYYSYVFKYGKNTVNIGRNASPGTIAHELFHKIDEGHRISQTLSESLMKDYLALNVISGVDIKNYLIQNFPEMFVKGKLTNKIIFKPEYRALSDIFNGLSGGKIKYGYGHKPEEWAKPGTLEAETWAQFGRILYENDPEVLKMFQMLFPNLVKHAMIALKGLM